LRAKRQRLQGDLARSVLVQKNILEADISQILAAWQPVCLLFWA
jgi:hypothetical protein